MKKYTYLILLITTFCTLGFALPSCNNEEDQKKQNTRIETFQQEYLQKYTTIHQEVQGILSDTNRLKGLIPQMTHVLDAQKKEIEELKTKLNEQSKQIKKLETKLAGLRKVIRNRK
jgi:peptidoglycan hydrolase CwlO-like protein